MTTDTTTSWTRGIRRLAAHRWLTLTLAGIIVGTLLVVTGVMAPNAVLSWGVVAAMLLMHLGGHGMHGQHQGGGTGRSAATGHGVHGQAEDAFDTDPTSRPEGTSRQDGGDVRHRAGGCH